MYRIYTQIINSEVGILAFVYFLIQAYIALKVNTYLEILRYYIYTKEWEKNAIRNTPLLKNTANFDGDSRPKLLCTSRGVGFLYYYTVRAPL